jgi:hypothetical protein
MGVRATTSHSSGKWYLEYPINTLNGISSYRGFASASQGLGAVSITAATGIGEGGGYIGAPGGSTTAPGGHNVQFAIDIDAGRWWARYDGGSWVGGSGSAGDPVAGTNGVDYTSYIPVSTATFPWVTTQHWTVDGVQSFNPGSSTFANTPPSGFSAWDTTAAVATPNVVHTSGANITSASSGTVAYQTIGADNIVILHSQSSPNHTSGSVNITTVTDTNGLTWTKKTSLHIVPKGVSALTDNTQEIWWAHAASAVSGTITVTFGATIDDGAFTTLSISGVYDVTAPFDPNSSLPATASNVSTTGAGTTPSVTISTTAQSTLVLGFYGAPINHGEPGGTNSLEPFVNQNNSGGVNYGYNYVGGIACTSPQTSIPAAFGSSVADWGLIVLALNGTNPITSPTGTMAITEANDAFHGVGYSNFPGVWGSLAVTEAKDVFASVGYTVSLGVMAITEAKDQFSAYGYLPVKGTMTITERPDIFHAVGFGAGGVNGIWTMTEAHDIFAAVGGGGSINGTFNITETPDRFLAIGSGVTQVRRRRPFFVT